MATGENAAVVRRAYEAFNTADMDTLIETFDESASWHTPGHGSLFRRPRGPRRDPGLLGRLGQETGGTFRATLRHMTEDDDGVVVGIQTSTGERNGKQLEVGNCIVFELKDGRITDGREHFEDLYAWDEFWS